MKDIEEIKRGGPVNPVEALASQALDALMAPEQDKFVSTGEPPCYETLIAMMAEAFRADDPHERRRVVGDILSSGVDAHEFIGSHVVDTAHLLGELWGHNKISFADVTIASARLQESVRSLSARRHTVLPIQPGPEILLIAPEAENHLLGLFIASEAFEALGCDMQLAIGQDTDQLVRIAQSRHFDMIGVSIGSNRSIKSAKVITNRLRKAALQTTPIVLGGRICADAIRHRELLEETGVDHVTSCPKEALHLCGIPTPRQVDPKDVQACIPEGCNE